MIGVDLDGTLLDTSGRLPERNVEAIARANEAGLMVVLCTGRGLAESKMVIEGLGHEGPVVLANGALVSDPTTGETLHRATVEPGLAHEVVWHLREQKHAVLILLDPEPMGVDYLVTQGELMTENTRWWFENIGATIRESEEVGEVDLHHALRVGVVGPGKAMPMLVQGLNERFGGRVFVQHFAAVKPLDSEDIHVLEVFANGVDKWRGLMWVAERHGIEGSEIAEVGDHINDVSMVSAAGCGIAMGNAVDVVKDCAARVTGRNDDYGVADAIDKLLGGEW